jgi:hypothetical protein
MHNLEDGYFKIVKLKTGENILCNMERDVKSTAAETHLHLSIPVQVVPMKETRKGNHVIGESFMLRPWMGLSDGEEFTISTDVVLTIGDMKREVKKQYVTYVTQAKESRQKFLEQEERSDAANDLLREVNNGDVRIIEIDDYHGEYYGEEEGRE